MHWKDSVILRRQRYMDLSDFICPQCKRRFPIMRNRGRKRKRGHIKDIWCPYCCKVQKFIEIRNDDFIYIYNGVDNT